MELLLEIMKKSRDSDKDGIPDKYMSGLSDAEKVKRRKEIEKNKKKDSDDKSAYDKKSWETDDGVKTKESKHTKKYKELYGESFLFSVINDMVLTEEATAGLKEKADKSGISVSILRQVYNRGMAAWRTGHRPGTTPQQWGMARVNSFITGGKTRTTADKDLWAKHKGKSVKESKLEERTGDLNPQTKYKVYSDDGVVTFIKAASETDAKSKVEKMGKIVRNVEEVK